MHVEFIVPPNLDKCELKPYVTWRASVVQQPELTTESLFEIRYADHVKQLHQNGKSMEEIISKL